MITEAILNLSAALNALGVNENYKIILDKPAWDKVCHQMGGMLQDEQGKFPDFNDPEEPKPNKVSFAGGGIWIEHGVIN